MAFEGLPAENATDWYGWAAQTDMLVKQPAANPLHEVAREKLDMARGEAVTVAPGVERTLLDVDGPGCAFSLWMAIAGPSTVSLDGRLRIYYDGSATPALDTDFGSLFASHFGASGPGHMTPHMHMELSASNLGAGIMMTFPMPFGDHIRIAFYNIPAAPNAGIYWMATYRLYVTDRADGWRLRGQGARFADGGVTLTATETSTRMSTTGGPGAVIWHSYVGGYLATSLSWMERNFIIRVDDETAANALIQSTGTEDWFDSAWYFQGLKDFNAGLYTWVGTDQPTGEANVVGMATDFLGKWGGVPFQSSCDLILSTEPMGSPTTQTFSDCVLYYSVA